MSLVREIVSLGRAARMGAKLKVRQPLAKVEVILADRTHQAWLEEHAALIADELNVKQVEFTEQGRPIHHLHGAARPEAARPAAGKQLPALKAALAAADAAALLAKLEAEKQVTLELPDGPVTLDGEDMQVRLQAKPGWAAAKGTACVVVLSTELTPDLVAEGLAREVVHVNSSLRRDIELRIHRSHRVGHRHRFGRIEGGHRAIR